MSKIYRQLRLGILLASVAATAFAQSAGTRAVISADRAPLYAKMSLENPPLRMLEKGEIVSIGLVLFGDDVTWCAVSRPGETKRIGYVSCDLLESEKAAAQAAAQAPPAAAIRIREVDTPPPVVREVTPVAVATRVEQSLTQEPAPVAAPPALAQPAEMPQPAAPKPFVPITERILPARVPSEVALDESAPPQPARPVEMARINELQRVPPPVPPPPVEVPRTEPKPFNPISEIADREISEKLLVEKGAPALPQKPQLLASLRIPDISEIGEPPAPRELTTEELTGEVLERSALRSQLTQFVRSSYALSFLDKKRLAAVDEGALAQIFHQQFRSEAFYSAVEISLKKESEAGPMRELGTWLESPLTGHMEDLLGHAADPEAREEIVAFADGLRKSPPTQARLILVHRLYEATSSCDMEVEATLATVRALAEALNPILPAASQFSESDLNQALKTVKAAYQPVMKNAKFVQYLFAFRSVSDEELEQYVAGWESDAGRWWTRVQRDGFASATRTIAANLKIAIPRRLGVQDGGE
jgi:hypothetical protein